MKSLEVITSYKHVNLTAECLNDYPPRKEDMASILSKLRKNCKKSWYINGYIKECIDVIWYVITCQWNKKIYIVRVLKTRVNLTFFTQKAIIYENITHALMVELADTLVSGTSAFTGMGVQVSLKAKANFLYYKELAFFNSLKLAF